MICSSVNRFRFICPSFNQGRTLTPDGGKTQWQVNRSKAPPAGRIWANHFRDIAGGTSLMRRSLAIDDGPCSQAERPCQWKKSLFGLPGNSSVIYCNYYVFSAV
jgi:hypothetical protein